MKAALAGLTGEDSTGLEMRAWQSVFALVLWMLTAYFCHTPPLPVWVEPLVPVPSLILVANALGPDPWAVRWLHPRRSTRLEAVVVVLISILTMAFALGSAQPGTDQPLTLKCASRDLLRGHDPYRTYEAQCAAELDYRGSSLTDVATGPFAHLTGPPTAALQRKVELRDQLTGQHAGFPPYGYPPDATLLLLPVAFAGWPVTWLYVMALCALLFSFLWMAGPRPKGWIVLCASQLVAFALMVTVFNMLWDPEFISYLLLAGAFAMIGRRRTSALLLAGAVCSNQLTWIVVPVYLAITLRESGAWERVAWLVGAIGAGMIPWWIWDHALPAQLLHFLELPYFPGGRSIGALFPGPGHSELYLVGLAGAIALCTAVAWRSRRWRWAMAAVVYGSFIVSSRGLSYYFMPLFWLSPAVLLGSWRWGNSQPQVASELALGS